MTDARLPERMLSDRRVLRLSNGAFRIYVMALLWSVSNRTDGRLDDDDLDLVFHASDKTRDEIGASGLWQRNGDRSWFIADFAITQTTAAQLAGLEHKRLQDRERKARQRARDAGRDLPDDQQVTRDVRRDVRPDRTRDTKEGRKDRKEGGLDDDESTAPANGHRPAREPWPAPRPLHPRSAAGYDN